MNVAERRAPKVDVVGSPGFSNLLPSSSSPSSVGKEDVDENDEPASLPRSPTMARSSVLPINLIHGRENKRFGLYPLPRCLSLLFHLTPRLLQQRQLLVIPRFVINIRAAYCFFCFVSV